MRNTKMLVLILLLAGLAAAVYMFWDICLTFFTAMVAAYLLGPPARWLARRFKLRHGLAVALVMVLFLVALGLLLSITVPYAVTQLSALMRDIGGYAESFDQLLAGLYGYLAELKVPQAVLDTMLDIISNLDAYLLSLFSGVLQGLVNLSLGIFDLIVTIILVIYFMLDGAKLMSALLSTLPRRVRQSVSRVTREANLLTRKYIRSRVLISSGMALVTYIGFSVMGIRYALLFAAVSFVLDFIPYFGSLLAGLIETLYALIAGGPTLAITVLVFVIIVQQIEGNVVAPKVEGEATGIHPITVMFALLASNKLLGPVGMLISTPLAAITKAVLREAYRFVILPEGYDPDQTSLEEG